MHQQHQVIIANLSNLEIPEIPGIPEIPEIPSFGILEISEAKPSPAVTFQLNQIMQFYNNNNKINLGCIHIIIFNKAIRDHIHSLDIIGTILPKLRPLRCTSTCQMP